MPDTPSTAGSESELTPTTDAVVLAKPTPRELGRLMSTWLPEVQSELVSLRALPGGARGDNPWGDRYGRRVYEIVRHADDGVGIDSVIGQATFSRYTGGEIPPRWGREPSGTSREANVHVTIIPRDDADIAQAAGLDNLALKAVAKLADTFADMIGADGVRVQSNSRAMLVVWSQSGFVASTLVSDSRQISMAKRIADTATSYPEPMDPLPALVRLGAITARADAGDAGNAGNDAARLHDAVYPGLLHIDPVDPETTAVAENPLPVIARLLAGEQPRSFVVIDFSPAEAARLMEATRDWVSHHPDPDVPLFRGQNGPLTPRDIRAKLDLYPDEDFVCKLFSIGLEGDTPASVIDDLANDVAAWSARSAQQSAADQSAHVFALLHAGFPTVQRATADPGGVQSATDTGRSPAPDEPTTVSPDDVPAVGGIWHSGGTVIAIDVNVNPEPAAPADEAPHRDTGNTAWHAGA